MKKHKATTYTLQTEGNISSSTIRRMKAGESVSTNTINALCQLFQCAVDGVIEFIDDETA